MVASLMHRLAPALYLALALPAVAALTLAVPPGMAPDESSHFLRAVQVAQGGWRAERDGAAAGGTVPLSAVAFGEALDPLIGHAERKVDPAALRDMAALRWRPDEAAFADFSNTAIYLPAFYLPAAAAVALGRGLDLSVGATFELARLANGAAAVALAAAAIALARRGRALLFALLSLPMTLSQFASASQDATLIGAVALAAGLLSRAAGAARPLRGGERLAAFGLLGLAAATRPPYAALLLLGLAAPLRPARPLARLPALAARLWAPALGAAAAGAWILLGAAPVEVPSRPGVSAAGQALYLLHHVAALPALAVDTLRAEAFGHYLGFVGLVGWYDAPLPAPLYASATAALLLAAGLAACEPGASLGRRDAALAAAASALAAAGVYAALYLSWTPVGAPLVDGVQGRYFIPIAAALALAVPALAGAAGPRGRCAAAAGPAWAALLACAAAGAAALPFVVARRFYG